MGLTEDSYGKSTFIAVLHFLVCVSHLLRVTDVSAKNLLLLFSIILVRNKGIRKETTV